MRNLKLVLALAATLMAFACPALAQNEFKTPAPGKTVVGVQMMCQDGGGNAVPCSVTFPLNIVGSLTASLSGFHPETSLAPITAAVGGATSSAFAAGKDVLAQNTGATNAAYCFPGNAASASSEYIPPGGSALIHTVAETTVTCVTASSTTNINLQVGVGLWTGAGAGGSGGSGGNVNITQILGAAPSATNPLWVSPATGATFPISTASLPLPSGAGTSANQTTIHNDLVTLNTTAGNPAKIVDSGGANQLAVNAAGALSAALNATPSNANGNGVIVNPLPRAARNFPGCTVGVASASCLAASTAVNFLQVQNTSASASIACAFGATAVLNSSGSFQLGAGQSSSWGPNTAGVPLGALNCIASVASTPLYVEWN